MAFSTWIRNWKRSLERRWTLYQALRRKAVARRLATVPRLEFLENRWLLSTYVVNTTADSGTGSLRDAITQANNTTSGITEIDFNIGTQGTNSGVQTISPGSALPALTASRVFINGSSENVWQNPTMPNASPLIELNGASAGITSDGLDLTGTSNTVSGLFITSFHNGIEVAGANNVIKQTSTQTLYVGNVISGNTGDGVLIDSSASGVVVAGSFIGTDTAGTAALANSVGIEVAGSNNTIGYSFGGRPASTLISGNTNDGVKLDGGSSGNVVQGSYIGTNSAGTAAVANSVGIEDGGSSNTIAGEFPDAPNVISGNSSDGVLIDSGATNETMQGNYIGLTQGGSSIANGTNGVEIKGTGNTIGGFVNSDNYISNNKGDGVLIDIGASGNYVQGNIIGVSNTGGNAVGNGNGIEIAGSSNTIGGGLNYGNIISGNSGDGVLIDSTGAGNVLQSNIVGPSAPENSAVPNSIGVEVAGNNNTIGGVSSDSGYGAAGSGNDISGNTSDGVKIDSGGSGNQVLGNYIGTTSFGNGLAALGNSIGILVSSSNNTIGGVGSYDNGINGSVTGAANVISANKGDGVQIASGVSGVLVLGNYIGTDPTGTKALANGTGVEVSGSNNTIGSGTAFNIISGNTGDGVQIASGASGVLLLGNYIGTDYTGTKALANGTGVEVSGSNDAIGSGAAFNVISGNTGDGVKIESGVTGVLVQGNVIGTNAGGTVALGNSIGIEVAGNNNTLGVSYAVAPNVISGNSSDGVKLDAGSSGNQVLGSYIGTNFATTAAVANSVGVEDGGSNNTIGGSVLGAKNVISGNSSDGVLIDSTATNEIMQSNYIGLNIDASTALANGSNGVEIGGSGNTIGGALVNAFIRNYISGNTKGDGVKIDSGASGNQVQGNFIGVAVSGTIGVANSIGIEIGGNSNTVGGTSAFYTNIISGNSSDGVLVDNTATGNVLQNNYVGTDYTGRGPLANSGSGVEIQGTGNTVGVGNVLSGNSADGLRIDSSASGNLVLGSLIGLNISGAGSNGANGVNVAGNNNTVGGTAAAARNIISGNSKDGVLIASGGSGNQVLGNWIGTNYNGTAAAANSIGVEVAGTSNTVGGAAGAGNVISGNSGDGVMIDKGGSGNQVLGNTIGVNFYDGAALANSSNGIEVAGSSNTLGASWAVAFNEISGNKGDGVKLDSGSSGNVVLGSYIGTDHTGTVAFANSVGIEDGGSSNTIGGSVLGARNVISGNSGDGVLIDSTAANETMLGNYIGTDYSASTSLANGTNGVEIQGSGNTIGGQLVSSLVRNYIDGNTKGDGVKIDSGSSGNQVLGNFIGVNISGTVGLANSIGVEIGGSNNTVGGPTNMYTNVLSGNSGDGVLLDSTGASNFIESNFVGTDYTGQAALGNSGSGIAIAGNNNTVYAGNVIAYNSNNGVLVSAGSGNMIRQNSIFSNTGLGISLASGANNNIAAPTISTATLSSGTLTVTGTFTATVGETYALEFFANPSGDAEGKLFLGSLPVTAASTTQDFTFTTTNTSQLGTYPDITATLTDNFGVGDTSEFSNAVTVSTVVVG